MLDRRLAAAAGLVLAAGTTLPVGVGPARAAGASRAASALVARFEAADVTCGLPVSPMTNQACEDRDNAGRRLAAAGWCRGEAGWNRCAPRALAHGRPRRPAAGHRHRT